MNFTDTVFAAILFKQSSPHPSLTAPTIKAAYLPDSVKINDVYVYKIVHMTNLIIKYESYNCIMYKNMI